MPHDLNSSGRLLLDSTSRRVVWQRLGEVLEHLVDGLADRPVAQTVSAADVRAALAECSFDDPIAPLSVVELVTSGLLTHQVHSTHPRYFGLFTSAPATMGIVAEALVAGFNPQLAGWTHSPYAVEIERLLIAEFAGRVGWDRATVEGTFATGGSEANHTAVLSALNAAYPSFASSGFDGIPGRPILYASTEAHGSVFKVAGLCGLGSQAIRRVATDATWTMDSRALAQQIERDRADGYLPFMVVATAGTTAAGVIDPLDEIADVARRQGLWLHVDAAWGGAVCLVPEFRPLLSGITQADSITLDAHKWLAMPIGAGIYLSRRTGLLRQTFAVDASAYAPSLDAGDGHVCEPYQQSMQWSRRFIGLKLFMSLLVAGWEGYAKAITHQMSMGDYLRSLLAAGHWRVVNDTPLPLVCFVDGSTGAPQDPAYTRAIARTVVASGTAWLSTATLGSAPGIVALRACVANYLTQPDDVDVLVRSLNEARDHARASVNCR